MLAMLLWRGEQTLTAEYTFYVSDTMSDVDGGYFQEI